MHIRLLFSALSMVSLVSCDASFGDPVLRQASVDGVTIGWRDFLEVSDSHRQSVEVGEGVSVYMFVPDTSEPEFVLSNGRTF